jgi:hypothetical protein
MKDLGALFQNGAENLCIPLKDKSISAIDIPGIDPNYDKAIYWYEKAADNGNADAMAALSDMYQEGLGVVESQATAKLWWDKAIENGHESRGIIVGESTQEKVNLSTQEQENLASQESNGNSQTNHNNLVKTPYNNLPQTKETKPFNRKHYPDFAFQHGLLSFVGYRVGQSGESRNTCQEILDWVYECPNLPKVNSEEYINGWGTEQSPERLKKMANSLAGFINSKKNHHDDFNEALNDWEQDLEYLKKEYYVKESFKFKWPSIKL